MTDLIPFNQRAWVDDLEPPDQDDEDGCAICGNPLDDGEGWDGLCGNCADVQESLAPDDHDRRYDAMYSDRTEVADNDMAE
jgi:hypothetical protein